MLLQNALHRRQTYACAFEALFAMQSLEHPKELARIPHVKAHSVTAPKEHGLAVQQLLAHLDSHRGSRARELDRVR